MEILASLERTDFSVWLRESDWGHPIVLCFHAVGMAMVVGISLMHSARVLGYARDFPLSAFDWLFRLAWFGFAINAVSGILLFVGEPRRLMDAPAFWIKMILIVLACLALWVLAKTLQTVEPEGAWAAETSANARVAAIFSAVFWLGAIVSGRLVGYTIGPPPL
jgi:hypothetical protein